MISGDKVMIELVYSTPRMAIPSGLRVAPGTASSNTSVTQPELRSRLKASSCERVTSETYHVAEAAGERTSWTRFPLPSLTAV